VIISLSLSFTAGLAWQYTAETISIVLVELVMAVMVREKVMTTVQALCILSIFPLSLVLVATLEFLGFD
jgi:hypothetical protein